MKGTSATPLLATGAIPKQGKRKWQSPGTVLASQTSSDYPQFRSGVRVF